MSYPGFQANQQAQLAAQVAQASASRGAQQNAALATRLGQPRPHHPAPRGGALGLFGRVVSIVVMVAVLLIVAVVALIVLNGVDPHAAEPVWRWLDSLG